VICHRTSAAPSVSTVVMQGQVSVEATITVRYRIAPLH